MKEISINRNELVKNFHDYLLKEGREKSDLIDYLKTYYPEKTESSLISIFRDVKYQLGAQLKESPEGIYTIQKDPLGFYNVRTLLRYIYTLYCGLEKSKKTSLTLEDIVYLINSGKRLEKVNINILTLQTVLRWFELMNEHVCGIKDSIKRENGRIYFTNISDFKNKCGERLNSLFNSCVTVDVNLTKRKRGNSEVESSSTISNLFGKKIVLRVEIPEEKLTIFSNYLHDIVVLDKISESDLIVEGYYNTENDLRNLYRILRGNEKILDSTINKKLKEQIELENKYLEKMLTK